MVGFDGGKGWDWFVGGLRDWGMEVRWRWIDAKDREVAVFPYS